jgi:hypothetical protein
MTQTMMIRSMLSENVIDIENNSSRAGASLDAYPAKSGSEPVLDPDSPPATLAANQSWEILPDPAGSSHHIIRNPASGHCIDIAGNSRSPGAALDAYTVKESDNQNQLWDLLPDPFNSGGFFIQNPQTGFVIDIRDGSVKAGAALIVNPMRMFDSRRQLWTGVVAGGAAADGLPLLTLATPPFPTLIGSGQYVLLPATQTRNLTGVSVTLDIIEDLIAETFSVQINGNPPYPPPGYTPKPQASLYKWNVEWIQFGLIMQNNSLVLFTQVWPPGGTGQAPAAFPNPSVQQSSPQSLLALDNNTIPAGTRIILTLNTDSNDFVISLAGKVLNGAGTPIGTQVSWSAVGRPTWRGSGPSAAPDGPPVLESNMAPLGAFQVVIVGPPSGQAHFTAGQGTLTVTAQPDISGQSTWPDPEGGGTGETSNMFCGQVLSGYHRQLVQPFGVPHPRLIPDGVPYGFSGSGLYPNSALQAKASFTQESGGPAVEALIESFDGKAAADGSFSLLLVPSDDSVSYKPGYIVAVRVTDAYGNWASCACETISWPEGSSSKSGTSPLQD